MQEIDTQREIEKENKKNKKPEQKQKQNIRRNVGEAVDKGHAWLFSLPKRRLLRNLLKRSHRLHALVQEPFSLILLATKANGPVGTQGGPRAAK